MYKHYFPVPSENLCNWHKPSCNWHKPAINTKYVLNNAAIKIDILFQQNQPLYILMGLVHVATQ